MNRMTRIIVLLAASVGSAVLPVAAPAEDFGRGLSTVAVVAHHVDVHPRSEKAARMSLRRLGEAAMQACGASSFSLREVKESAVARSLEYRARANC